MNNEVIRKNILFKGLSDDDYNAALRLLEAEIKKYKKGELLNRIGFPMYKFGLVISGIVQVYMDDIDGNEMIMASVSPGGTFGESLCYLQKEAPIYIQATNDCEILWLNPEKFKRTESRSILDIDLASRFASMLAYRTLSMNDRIQILSKTTLRQKLITFFSQYTDQHNTDFTVPFSRNDMATYLGTDRSALSRELSQMKKDGIIAYNKNTFRIIKNFDI